MAGVELSLHLPNHATAPLAAVLVFHSAMGRTASVLDHADALARAGYAACVLDFYDGHVASSLDEGRALRGRANTRNAELTELVAGAWAKLRSDPRIAAERRFLLGWSYGAAWATFAAGSLEGVSGVVAFYGEAFGTAPALYERFTAPVLLVGATGDTGPSPKRLREVQETLAAQGTNVSVLLVDGQHGFMERTHPGYREQIARIAWEAALRFLRVQRRGP